MEGTCLLRLLKTKASRYIAILLLATAFAIMPGCCYLTKQGFHLARYQIKATKISRVLEKNDDPQLESFLELAGRIKRFAVDSLGLARGSNYSTYLDNPKGYAVDVVSAAKPDTFEQHAWCYPIVGCVPYKGFFAPEDAAIQAQLLSDKGLDIYTWKADAFSTLGFLTDPLVSYMQEYTPYELASLLIHEQTHATVYIRGQAQFNEELATFIGREGALRFLAATYGDSSNELTRARARLQDLRRFYRHIGQLYNRLDSLYAQPLGESETIARKNDIIAEDRERFLATYDSVYTTRLFRGFAKRKVNNAYLAVYQTYTRDLDLYYALLEQNNGDLRETIKQTLSVEKSKKPPKEYLNSLVK